MKEAPTVSIIIVSWNTRDLLRRCLESVYTTLPPISFEVIVIDNASDDGSADAVEERFSGVRVIRNAENVGFSAGCNAGIRMASGQWAMLLNPDAKLLPGAVQAMIEFAAAHPEAAVIGPKLINSDGTMQKNGRRFPYLLREILGITRAYKLIWNWFDRTMEYGRSDFDRTAEVDEICGACMFVRKAAIDRVGLLDEQFFMYYEEVDWCRRIKQAGWKVYYLPDAHVMHHWAQAAKQTGLDGSRIFYRSQYLYFRKHHGPAQALILRSLSNLLLMVLLVKRRLVR